MEKEQEKERELVSSRAVLYHTGPQLWAHIEIVKPSRTVTVSTLFSSFKDVIFNVLWKGLVQDALVKKCMGPVCIFCFVCDWFPK